MSKYVDLEKFCGLILNRFGPVDVACSSGKTIFFEGSSTGHFYTFYP